MIPGMMNLVRRVQLQLDISGRRNPAVGLVVRNTIEVFATELTSDEQCELLSRSRQRVRAAAAGKFRDRIAR